MRSTASSCASSLSPLLPPSKMQESTVVKEPRDLGGQGGGEGVCGANFAVEEAERERREEVEQGLGGSHERGVPAPGEVTWWVVTAADWAAVVG